MTVELLGVDESRPGVRELVQATLDLVRGLGLADTITDDTRRRKRILDRWADDSRRRPWGGMNDLLEAVLADLAAEGDRLDGLVAPLPEAGLATPTPAAGWDVAHQVAHLAWTDEAALCRGHRQAGLGRTRAGGDRRPRRASSTGRPLRGRRARRRAARPLADGPGGAGRGPAGAARGHRRCRGTARRCAPPRWPPPASWRPGRTRLDVTTRWASRLPPTDRVRHVAHLGVRTRDFAFAIHRVEPPAEEFRVSPDAARRLRRRVRPAFCRADRDRSP